MVPDEEHKHRSHGRKRRTEDEKERAAAQPALASEEPEQAQTPDRAPCPVVGVGASAGGLEALQGLFAGLPRELNAAFVVVQHRASARTSVMRSLIEKHTPLAFEDITERVKT